MIFLVTYGFDGQSTGWSETHACSSVSTNPADLVPAAIGIAQKRVQFLGREFSLNRIRISRYSNDAGTQRLKGHYPVKQRFANSDKTVVQAAEPAIIALQVTGYTTPQLAPERFVANSNFTYCGAPADDCVNNAGVVNPAKSGLDASFATWSAALIAARYGWLAADLLYDLEIDSISQEVNGKVRIVVKAPTGPNTLAIGIKYPGRARQINEGRSPLNGELGVRYVAALTFVTTATIGLALAQVGGNLKIYNPIYPFVGFGSLVLNLEVAKHQRGLPFGATRGRRPNRIRG